MALEMTYYLEGVDGLEITNAYLRIETLDIVYNPELADRLTLEGKGSGNKWIVRDVMIAVKKAKNKRTITLFSGRFSFAYDHTNNDSALKQAYNHLKTLSDFSGAIDVLD